MNVFKVGDMVVLTRGFVVDEVTRPGDIGCVTSIESDAHGQLEQRLRVKFWTAPDKEYTYAAWRLKPL